MSGELRVNNITDEAGTGAPNFPNGATGISSYEDQDALDLFNVTGSAPVYACRAWVNFNGTGTVSIRESGNVSSITDNGTGNYTVNFTTAMEDANYSAVSGVDSYSSQNRADHSGQALRNFSASSVVILTGSSVLGTLFDNPVLCVSFFR